MLFLNIMVLIDKFIGVVVVVGGVGISGVINVIIINVMDV